MSPRITIEDVAREARVSVTAASRALNGRGELSADKRARVLAVAQRLQFVPSSVARALVSGKTNTLGVLITDNTSPVYAELLRGIEEVANAEHFGLLFGNSGDSQERALRWLNMVHAKHVDGVLLTPVQTDEQDIRQLLRWKIPFVLLYRHFSDLDTDYVVADNVRAGFLVTDHLARLGHRRIGHVGGPPQTSSARNRCLGYRQALAEHGLPYDPSLVLHGPYTIAGGTDVAARLLDRPDRPTAIFASTDLQAIGVFKVARGMGFHVPEDLSLAGGDDIEFAALLEVPLTTFTYPAREIGQRGAHMLLARLRGDVPEPHGVVVAPRLLVRCSTGTPRT